MVISVCVILGFKSEIQQKMTGIGAHIEVLDMKSLASPEDFPITAPTAFVQAVARTQGVSRADRVAYKIGIIKTNDDFADITLKGLEANYDTAFLASCLKAGRLPLLDGTAETSEVAISQSVADDMHLKVGDKVFAYFFEQTIKMRRFTITGIYETHMKMYDEVLAFTDFETVARLNAWEQEQCSEVEIRVEDNDRIGAVSRQIAALNQQYPEPTGGATKALLTIDQHYPQIFSWLELLDFNMVVILLLMVLVGGFTMVSGLLILILERTATIGLLKAIGMTNRNVRHVFLYFAAMIVVRALVIGNLFAFALLWAQRQWGLIHLDATTYYVDTVPVVFDPLAILAINVGALVLTLLALVAPSFMVSRIDPAQAIRYE